VLTGLPNRLTAAFSGVAADADSTGLAIAVVTAEENSASVSESVAEKMDTRGAAPAMAPTIDSSLEVR
jgi:hypothetical protein